MAVPSSSSSSSSREQGARLLCCYLLLIPIVFILVFAPVFVYVDRRTSQKALLNFSVVVLIVVFSVMWRVYLRGTVGLRTPVHSERFTSRYHNERRRLGSTNGGGGGAGLLLERPRPVSSSSATAAVYFSAISSSSSSDPRHSSLLRGPHPAANAMIVHLTIPIDMEAHRHHHHHPLSHPLPPSFHPQVVRSWPDNPPPYHVAVDLPAPDAIRYDTRQSIVESPPPPYEFATENDPNRRNP